LFTLPGIDSTAVKLVTFSINQEHTVTPEENETYGKELIISLTGINSCDVPLLA
jgi:hypothetical protein